jgi:hypothetical protein
VAIGRALGDGLERAFQRNGLILMGAHLLWLLAFVGAALALSTANSS